MNLFEIVQSVKRNLKITTSYFFPKSTRYKVAVEQYPDTISGKTSFDLFPKAKGYLKNDLVKCTGCGDCIPICPVKALSMEASVKVDASVDVKRFSIDLGRCFSCSACAEICPAGSLSYSREYELATDDLDGLIVNLFPRDVPAKTDNRKIRTYEVRR